MKSQQKRDHKFPQIFRGINAKHNKNALYSSFLSIIFFGLFILILINLVFIWQAPPLLKKLLIDPTETNSLAQVLERTVSQDLEIELKDYLQSINQLEVVQQSEDQKIERLKEISRVKDIIKQYPQYPDGWAYLSLLFFEDWDCFEAESANNQALKLDSTRATFKAIAKLIKSCE